MNLQNVRWSVVVVAMAVTLAVLFGVGFAVKSQMWEGPLKALYSGSPAVASYTVEQNNGRYTIEVALKDAPDLGAAYRALDEGTSKILATTPYTLKVTDRRTPALADAYRPMNLDVQEALATGRFSVLAERVQSEAAKDSLTASVDVDNNRVYIALKAPDGAYLYSVVDRPQPVAATLSAEGGVGL